MQPVIDMFIGTWADMRPSRNIFSPVSGWNAESYRCFACHISFSDTPGNNSPFLDISQPDAAKAQIPLRRLCDKVRDKFPTKSRTQIMKVRNTNHVADFHDLCRRLSWFVSTTFPVEKFWWKSA